MKFLIVDDSLIIRKTTEFHIETAYPDAEIFLAEDGKEAMLLLLKKKINPNLILMDYNMPGMNGGEALREIKKNSELCKIPVIMVTSEAKKEFIIELIKLGAVDYLTKPYNPQDFIDKIKKHLK